MGFVGRPSGNQLVEGVVRDAPGLRDPKTRHAGRFSINSRVDGEFNSPPRPPFNIGETET